MIRYCAHCGTELRARPPVECAACHAWTWVDAKPSASAVIVREGGFLAVRRAHEPAAGQWDIPGGFCDGAEHPEGAAIRETHEETGLHVSLGPLIGLYLGEYTYRGDRAATLNAYYLAQLTDPDAVPRLTDETAAVQWLDLHDPPALAFDHQKQMITDAAAASADWAH